MEVGLATALVIQLTEKRLEKFRDDIQRGPRGFDGRDGRDGLDGQDGRPGIPGDMGPMGRDGRDGEPGPQGRAGKDGRSFELEDYRSAIQEILENVVTAQRESLRGPQGENGAPFVFENHAEEIFSLIQKAYPKADLKGQDGKDFDWETSKANVVASIMENMPWEDLRGKDGRDFSFPAHRAEMEDITRSLVLEMRPSLMLQYDNLTLEEKKQIRGPRGPVGKAGKHGKNGHDFIFNEHVDEIASVLGEKLESIRDQLTFKFENFTPSELDKLKLKFSDLTEDEQWSLKGEQGPRGLAGEQGPQGEEGPQGKQGLKGIPGIQGPIGLTGPKGLAGVDGRNGIDGKDGLNAPTIEDVEIQQPTLGELLFKFTFSNGDVLKTNKVKLPISHSFTTVIAGQGDSSVLPIGYQQLDVNIINNIVPTGVETTLVTLDLTAPDASAFIKLIDWDGSQRARYTMLIDNTMIWKRWTLATQLGGKKEYAGQYGKEFKNCILQIKVFHERGTPGEFSLTMEGIGRNVVIL